MTFRIVDSYSSPSSGNEVLLVRDNWNDWFTWVTQFYVVVVTADKQRIDIGQVKIAKKGMTVDAHLKLTRAARLKLTHPL